MNFQNYFLDAIDVVLAWDISNEAFADAVKSQACLMAGSSQDENTGSDYS